MEKRKTFADLVGETIVKITGLTVGEEDFTLTLQNGQTVKLYYDHDCCASCVIEDVCGDPHDLLNSPILLAEENSNSDQLEEHHSDCESFTWTFYRLTTIKGSVVIRWFGESNGYYSESVTVEWKE